MGSFQSRSRLTGEIFGPTFVSATLADVDQVCKLAWSAYKQLKAKTTSSRADFLEICADQLNARRDEIVQAYQHETGLPEGRANGELDRTCNQLRLFARVVRDGTWLDRRVDLAIPDRKPLPKPDMRSMNRPLGPVAVLGASNFALAFSAVGGDTASALAAGCPVVCKAHPAHPVVTSIVAEAIEAARVASDMPVGTYAVLYDDGFEVGQALVQHPKIRAVGFTGSRKGGLALVQLANARPQPIPVFAEMSSVNPVFVLPERLGSEPENLAAMIHGSVTMGVGQFCTNPGLIFLCGESGSDAFVNALGVLMTQTPAACMLTDSIEASYRSGVNRLKALGGVHSASSSEQAALFVTDGQTFRSNETLREEIFGPCTLVVRCSSVEEATGWAAVLEGQLTATIIGTESEVASCGPLVEDLEDLAGRLLINQMPTGLEVCDATVHGGPFPATSDGRTTSVGSRAIERWTRPICYQNFPDSLLPAELQRNR
ncbi:MAG TPA: aldehyde dehydrogenase (NADP(+)) [Fimbriimonadaceae bacterium]|nr:aldehyde dehydrogenase (NADP(+)) [Fimbriimonadaceae bacterium]